LSDSTLRIITGIFLGNLEFAGWKPAGAIVAVGSGLFAVRLIVIGAVLLF
jgi:hypothetical protein